MHHWSPTKFSLSVETVYLVAAFSSKPIHAKIVPACISLAA
jgi:hypothetical protein